MGSGAAELSQLKQQVQDIKTKLGNLATNCNPLFPNVDPRTISTPPPVVLSASKELVNKKES